MKESTIDDAGIKQLLQRHRNIFQILEILDYYSEADYRIAERKFLKYALGQTEVVDRK